MIKHLIFFVGRGVTRVCLGEFVQQRRSRLLRAYNKKVNLKF